ncbi:hypothetical protein C471_08435 [Halorubrum saccharovorum DSM 1137]|uniref:HTH marR-type domain-containing protein n=1 Tax=Halorubrum saccharovorum DSM 1137 TaxID=1227484 RepID=M0DUZ9_9EURY|nr:hypothetical protein C471_08435 [Halorubrum saccharovorum DSM 1137]
MSRGPDPSITTLDILRVFLKSPDPAFIAPEIADEVGHTTDGVRRRMNALVDQGLLAKKKTGERSVLYWITEEGVHHYASETSDC